MRISDCIVLAGSELEPHRCAHFETQDGLISKMDLVEPCQAGDAVPVILPGLVNSHTHVGDSFLPDGATGMTLEQGFFRPDGFKYRELSKLSRSVHIEAMAETLTYMAETGTVAHIDFREQGPEGSSRLFEASQLTGVRSIILGQFHHVPFDYNTLLSNNSDLSAESRAELLSILTIADGFSESTMNDLTDTAWREIAQVTQQLGKGRAIHCLENTSYRSLSIERTNRGDLHQALEIYKPDIIVHLTVANSDEIALLASSKVTAVVNPRANANLGLPLPPIAALLDAGVNLLIGTDNGLLNSPNLFAELDFAYKITKSQYGDAIHPEPAEILRMATSNVAATRWGKEFPGTLQIGGPATFTVVDFTSIQLKRSAHVVASLLTRVTPVDIQQTVLNGLTLYQRSHT
jgi:cytosine/adenosine deaminase-related metal-dependent hydrolase